MNLYEKVTLFVRVKRLSDKCDIDGAMAAIDVALTNDALAQERKRSTEKLMSQWSKI